MRTPFELDTELKSLAEAQSLRVVGRWKIRVDESLLPKHLMKLQPDWSRIRQLVNQGEEISGVTVGRYEYVLQEPEEGE